MGQVRNIIQIDEELCNGCGQCVLDCAEGALKIIDGKAKLVGEIYCDGLGACLSGCPTGALTVTQRQAEDFDEKAVEKLLKSQGRPLPPPQNHAHAPGGHHDHHHGHGHGHHHGHGHPQHGHGPGAGGCPSLVNAALKPPEPAPLACGCPGSSATALKPGAAPAGGPAVSTLGHWPLKLTLLAPQAPFLKNADLVLLADCTAAALPDLHSRVLPGKAVAMACPKLDDAQAHIQKLAQVLAVSQPKTLTVAIMEVPCCRGLQFIAQEAVKLAGLSLPVKTMVVARDGRVLEDPLARQALA